MWPAPEWGGQSARAAAMPPGEKGSPQRSAPPNAWDAVMWVCASMKPWIGAAARAIAVPVVTEADRGAARATTARSAVAARDHFPGRADLVVVDRLVPMSGA